MREVRYVRTNVCGCPRIAAKTYICDNVYWHGRCRIFHSPVVSLCHTVAHTPILTLASRPPAHPFTQLAYLYTLLSPAHFICGCLCILICSKGLQRCCVLCPQSSSLSTLAGDHWHPFGSPSCLPNAPSSEGTFGGFQQHSTWPLLCRYP